MLRRSGVQCVIYIDDIFTCALTIEECQRNVRLIVETLQALGIVVHPDKSVFHPSQQIVFLGFSLDSRIMAVTVALSKMQGLIEACTDLLHVCKAEVVGKLVATCPGVLMGPLYFRQLENEKIAALKSAGRGPFRGQNDVI
jgi:hypothetical protein